MRGLVVLCGMVIAAAVAMLVWLDAADQVRPWLSASPTVVIELSPAVQPETAESADLPDEPALAPESAAAGTNGEEADETAANDGFADGAVSLDDVPIAADGAASPDDAETLEIAAAEPVMADDEIATEPSAVPPNDTTDAKDAGADVAEEPAAEAMAEPVAAAQSDDDNDAASQPEPETAADADETAGAAADSGTQLAALPAVPRDPDLPWLRFAAPFPSGDPRPRIAIVFTSLGLSDAATEAILREMPPAVSLAFSPYSRKLQRWLEQARAGGHEVLIDLPMEPLNYPEDDPGPLALLSTRPMEDNVTRLEGILARAEGVVGVAAQMGSRFSSSPDLLRPVLRTLAEHGYLYVDNGTAPTSVVPMLAQEIPVPLAVNDQFLDTEASRIAIDGRLQQIERIARSEGAAVAFAAPYPITIERLVAWIPTLETKGFVLAPITAIVGEQVLP